MGVPGSRRHMAAAVLASLSAGALGIYLAVSLTQPGKPQPAPSGPKLPFAEAAQAKRLPELAFEDGAGQARSLADFRGRVVLLNLWATWCTPCREEMPALDRLQARLGGPEFEVVALSVDQQGLAPVRRFFDEVGIGSLKPYVDPSAQAAFRLGALGLPATLLVDREGLEIGRHVGPAAWDAPQIVQALQRHVAERRPR